MGQYALLLLGFGGQASVNAASPPGVDADGPVPTFISIAANGLPNPFGDVASVYANVWHYRASTVRSEYDPGP